MTNKPKTIRLLMPQWQGGNNGGPYPIGARLLAWLAPDSDAPLVEVPVEPYDGTPLSTNNGIVGRDAIVKQLRAARHIIDAYSPDRVIVFGGDCLVSQAPFAYLNERYNGKLGVLWIDAHPDIATPKESDHAHAMVLGNLLGEGDTDLAKEVSRKIDPEYVMLAGVNDINGQERAVIDRLGLSRVTSQKLENNSDAVTAWIRGRGIAHIAVHVDLDVLDPRHFRSLLFNNPEATEPVDAPEGTLSFTQLTRIINDVAACADVVGIAFAEHMPWDDINLKTMLDQFAFLK